MSRKVENWLEDLEKRNAISKISETMSGREISILSATILDLALVHLLERRLLKHDKETETFLGLNDDGMAPAGSLGARIQLAFLLGIISEDDLKVFRAFKSIRNKFAHKMNLELIDSSILPFLITIFNNIEPLYKHISEIGTEPRLDGSIDIRPLYSEYKTNPIIAKRLLITTVALYENYFVRKNHFIERLAYKATI